MKLSEESKNKFYEKKKCLNENCDKYYWTPKRVRKGRKKNNPAGLRPMHAVTCCRKCGYEYMKQKQKLYQIKKNEKERNTQMD